ncbi:ADP-ribosyltransferase [Methanimicrococcus sp. OttesenSCG-928-J09]|nr:ADP-ribosyltransferase [Methanimicrococcus sp. OttesenSCG-928-J09]
MVREERELVDFNVQCIDSAIEKSKVKGMKYIYRGVFDTRWLRNPKIGSIYTDKAFGSYSLKIENAIQYTDPLNPIIFQFEIEDEIQALYIDESECEILRSRNISYEIVAIEYEMVRGINNLYMIATVYTIKEIRK